jgi:hypothetical protein
LAKKRPGSLAYVLSKEMFIEPRAGVQRQNSVRLCATSSGNPFCFL